MPLVLSLKETTKEEPRITPPVVAELRAVVKVKGRQEEEADAEGTAKITTSVMRKKEGRLEIKRKRREGGREAEAGVKDEEEKRLNGH